MFEAGRSYSVKMVDGEAHSQSQVTVLDMALPLLKVTSAGREEIINVHSLHFISATPVELSDGDDDDWSEFLPDYLKPGETPQGQIKSS